MKERIIKKTYTYKTPPSHHELKADVYQMPGIGVSPAAIWIHGGALIVGDRELSTEAGTLTDALLKAAFTVISIDYRLAPEVKLPVIIEDVQDACRWVRARGPELLGIDSERIAVMGGSAGGYLTLTAGYCVTPRPKALVSFWGYGDIAGLWYSRPDPFYCQQAPVSEEEAWKDGGGRLYLYLRQKGLWPKVLTGHDPDTEPGAFDPFCPVRNVTPDYPPTLLIHGTHDTDVPYEQSSEMSRELALKGVPHELITVSEGEHGLPNISAAEIAGIHEKVVVFMDSYLRDGAASKFFSQNVSER